MALRLYNTLTRQKEDFTPIHKDFVGLYTCGPTVYNYAHIGNLRSYVFADILEKTLIFNNYKVKRVMNMTDIGHLASDADDGEDKMTKGLIREGKELTLANMKELGKFYAEKFKEDLLNLNIKIPEEICFASDYIKEDIDLVQILKDKGYAYNTSDGIYFDISKFSNYFQLSGKKNGFDGVNESRIDVNTEKINPADFAIWKLNERIGFPSPFGQGFPGWHIECSAMSMKYLGEQFDIHTGGVDHINIHHTNEIAQSEAVTGKSPFVKFWMHNEHVDISGAKMAKSGDNFITLQSVKDKGLNPLAYRFWLLSAQYRTKMNFSWEAVMSAEIGLHKLYRMYLSLGNNIGTENQKYLEEFKNCINDDLNTPRTLVIMWNLLSDDTIENASKKATILKFDEILGLNLKNIQEQIVPDEIKEILKEREEVRRRNDWQKSDELRKMIKDLGYDLKDTNEGTIVSKI